MAIQLMSNVKIITSGKTPTTDNLKPGEAAFGKLDSDNLYHIFGNTGEGSSKGEVVDLVLSTMSKATIFSLQEVLEHGNKSTIDIEFDDENGNITVIGSGGFSTTNGTNTITIDAVKGFQDNGSPVLSANPNNVISDDQAQIMRDLINTYSKLEIENKLDTISVEIATIQDIANEAKTTSEKVLLATSWNLL